MKPKVYIAREIPSEVAAYLDEYFQCERWMGTEPITNEQLRCNMANVEGLLITGTTVDAALLAASPNLRVVSDLSVGYNNFDLKVMKERSIIGTHTPYVLDETVADLTFALVLSTARRITEMDRFVKAGQWKSGADDTRFGVDVHHATIGIIGMGRIGEAVARRASLGFKMNVLYHNRSRKPEAEQRLGLEYRSLEQLLRESDFVVMLAPSTSETYQIIGKSQFEMMKPSANFINVSRGETVDEAALVKALQNGTIRAAGLDVYEHEPIAFDHPILQLDNVVTLPHLGSATAQTRFDMAMLAARNLVDALIFNTPQNVVPELK